MNKNRALPDLLGQSEGITAIRKLLPVVAVSRSTVLITGESGTGKEIIARSLHELSDRSSGNFVPINCAAIPKELIESELFGHRKGAFTGALNDRVGRFELAHNGSIFLDEIGDLPLDLQVKLLRVLQERVVDPVGGGRQVAVDVRVIAATHRNLEAEIAAGRFRGDLFYRINVLPLNTPPLRERLDDLPLLLEFFAKHHCSLLQEPITFAADFLHAMALYHWPGNVRELSNLVDRFSTLFAGQRLELRSFPKSLLPREMAVFKAQIESGEIPLPAQAAAGVAVVDQALESLHWHSQNNPASGGIFDMQELVIEPPAVPDTVEMLTFLSQELPVLPPEGLSLKHRLAEIERDLIKQALDRALGNVSQAARILNVQRTTLIEKIQKFGLSVN